MRLPGGKSESHQVDDTTSQPVQKMIFEELLLFVARKQKLAGKGSTCKEAGALGYPLHRRLAAMGVTNFALQPQDCDDPGQGRQIRLGGNKKALRIMRVPTDEEEREEFAFAPAAPETVRTGTGVGE